MEQYKNIPERFNEHRKKILRRAIPNTIIAAAGGLTIAYFNTNSPNNNVSILPVLIPLMIILLVFRHL